MDVAEACGLRQMVIEPGFARLLPVHLPAIAGQRHENGAAKLRMFSHTSRNLVAVDVRQADVEQDGVGPERMRLIEPAEPFTVAQWVRRAEDTIGDIRRRTGCGILLISHDLHVVMAETDTVICMNGHVCCRGTPQAVVSSPEYLALFGARAAGTLAVYSHSHDHTHLPDGRVRHADGTVTDHCHPEEGHHEHGGGRAGESRHA